MTDSDMQTAAPSHPDWRAYAAEILARARVEEARNDAERASLLKEHGDAADDLPPLKGEGDVSYTSRRQQMMILCLAATIGSEARLQAAFERGAIVAITGLPDDRAKDVRRLLPLMLPPGWQIARTEHERRRRGAVAVIQPGQTYGGSSRDQLERDLVEALTLDVPVMMLLPEGMPAAEILGVAKVPLWPFRGMDREIAAQLLVLSWPGSDPAVLQERLPSDDHLAETPMLPLMLSLRSESVEEALRVLCDTTTTSNPRTFKDKVQAIAADKAKAEARQKSGIRLADLAGLGTARDTAIGIVEDLRAWQAGELPWDAVHRGMLIAGPPGCGKTELARAMAREPGIHLESASYAQWQSRGHLGDLLKAMRASFSTAADQAPSVLFVDELDAFGSRTSGRTSQHQSYDSKVIAALLEQLDGIDGRQGVIVVGACNHPDHIDPAILRAGRFDERFEIGLPDAAALATILRQHLGSDLPRADLAAMGQMAFGLSGADCAAAIRAARGVARRAKRPLTPDDLRTALVPNHLALPPNMRRRAAVHEAGHAVVMTALGVGEVKALRLSPNGGETRLRWFNIDVTRDMLQQRCAAHLAGRAAEILLLGEASGGAGGTDDSDLHVATMLMLQCHLSLGLGDMGHLSLGAPPPAATLLSMSGVMRQNMQRDLDRALTIALEVLQQNQPLLESLARELETRGFLVEVDLTAALAPIIKDAESRHVPRERPDDTAP